MNFWCSLYNCIYLFVATTAGWDLLAFCRAFPEVQSSLGPLKLCCLFWYLLWVRGLQGCCISWVRHVGVCLQAGWYVALFCLCGAIGQLFIFGTIKKFGSLVNTLICTTRKFFNILLSVLWNGNPLLPQQWLAVFLVFAGLLTSSIAKSGKKKVVAEVSKEEKKVQ